MGSAKGAGSINFYEYGYKFYKVCGNLTHFVQPGRVLPAELRRMDVQKISSGPFLPLDENGKFRVLG
jgi:hypothetical protein